MRHLSGLSRRTRFGFTLVSSLAAALVAAPATEARITKIEIDCARSQSPTFCPGQGPTFGGLSFGSAGQYEKLRGKAFGELEPLKRQNEVITDISLAPRNAGGKVEYSMDILILKPLNLSKGNHRILLDMNNRGELRLAR